MNSLKNKDNQKYSMHNDKDNYKTDRLFIKEVPIAQQFKDTNWYHGEAQKNRIANRPDKGHKRRV